LKRDSFRFAFPSTLSANAALVGFRLATNAVANKKTPKSERSSAFFIESSEIFNAKRKAAQKFLKQSENRRIF
jgi:hypothetical protein